MNHTSFYESGDVGVSENHSTMTVGAEISRTRDCTIILIKNASTHLLFEKTINLKEQKLHRPTVYIFSEELEIRIRKKSDTGFR